MAETTSNQLPVLETTYLKLRKQCVLFMAQIDVSMLIEDSTERKR